MGSEGWMDWDWNGDDGYRFVLLMRLVISERDLGFNLHSPRMMNPVRHRGPGGLRERLF